MTYWWERLKNESDAESVIEFMRESDFLVNVSVLPVYVYIDGDYVEIPNHRVCVRKGKPLYVVKKRFRLLKDDECFKILDLFKSVYPGSKFISCGDMLNGKKSYMIMKIDKINICGDEFSEYLTVTNGFDGRNAVNCILTLVRKKDNSVLQISDDLHKRIWTMGRIDVSLKFEMVKKEIENYLSYVRDMCLRMNNTEIILNDVINPMFSLDWKKTKTVNKNLAEEKEYIREIYMKNNGKSLYDLYFAMSSYYCNYKLKRNGKLGDDIRFDFAMCGYFYKLHDYEKYLIKLLND